MKKFLLELLLFLFPVILLSYFADHFLSTNLKKSKSYAFSGYPVWNDLYSGKINSNILINGTSTARVSLNPVLISDSLKNSAYNLGIDGYNFQLQYFRYSLLLEHSRIKPKLIIQVLDLFTLVKLNELFNPDQFLPYMFYHKDVAMATQNYKGYNWLDYRLPFVRYYGKRYAISNALKSFTNGANDQMVDAALGYEAQFKQWNNDLQKAKSKIKSYEVIFDNSLVALFEKYLNECKSKNIKIVFVYCPEYIEGQKFVKNRNELINKYNEISQKFNIPFLNYSNDSISFQKKYFYNSLHLNKAGSEVFTNQLIKDLKKYPLEILGL